MAEQNWLRDLEGKLFGIRQMQDGGTTLVDTELRAHEFDTLNAVHPLRAAANPAESRFDLSIEPTALIPSVPTAQTAYVDPVNGDDGSGQVGERTFPYLTIGAAIAGVILAGPAVGSPYLILAQPGSYSEQPLIVPSYVTLASVGGPNTVIVPASVIAAPLVSLQANSVVVGLTLSAASGAGGHGVRLSAAGTATAINCVATGCETGFAVTNASSVLTLVGCVALGRAGAISGISATAGTIQATNCAVSGAAGDQPPLGFVADGAAARIVLSGSAVASLCDVGYRVATGGYIGAADAAATECVLGFDAPSGLLELATGAGLENESDLSVGATGEIATGGLLHEQPLTVATGGKISGIFFDRSRSLLSAEGAFCVGAPARPGVLTAGEGCPTVEGLVALHYDGVTWTDVTDELVSSSGSAIDVVPGLGIGNYLYLGADSPIYGLLLDQTLAQVGGTITPEYDAGGWTVFSWLTTAAAPPHAPAGNALFASTGLRDMRFGPMPGWVTSVQNGITKYWIRLGVTSALTTAPQLESVRLHGSYTRIGEGGIVQFFGASRPTVETDLAMATWRAGAGTAPGTASVAYSANVTVGSTAAFVVSPSNRELGRRIQLPPGVDTSWPIELRVEWYPSTTNTGALNMTLYHARVPAGAILAGGLTESLIAATPTPPGVIGQTSEILYSMSWPAAIAGADGLAMTIRRLGGDPFTGDAIVTRTTLRYRAWRL